MAKRKPILEPDTNYASVPVAEEAASDESQGSPLLDDDPLYIDIDQPVYSGTVLSSCINITNTILGSGMLAMPSAFAATGLGLGCLLVIVAATCSAIGLLMLSKVASLVGRKSSFFACSGITYPYAAVWFDLAIAIKCFGVSVSYLVICGDLLPQVVAGFMPWVAADSIWRTKLLWITFCIFGISPTCFLTRLDSLRYTSAFALTAVFYLLFVVIVFFISPPATGMPFPMPKLSEIVWFSLDSKLVSHLPIFVFAFTCHQNIFSIYNELQDNSSPQMYKVIRNSVGTALSVYQTIGIIGYLTFGQHVTSNIIAMYPASGLVTGGQLAIALLVILSYPLQCHPCRASVFKVLWNEPPIGAFPIVTVIIMVLSYVLAATVKDLSTVLALVGATGSTTICYILPGLFYYKANQNMNKPQDVLSYIGLLMIVMGVFVMGSSLTALAYGATAGH